MSRKARNSKRKAATVSVRPQEASIHILAKAKNIDKDAGRSYSGPDNTVQVLVEEYKLVRGEQLERTKFRDNVLILSLGFVGAVVGFGLADIKNVTLADLYAQPTRSPISSLALYAVPFTSFMLTLFWWTSDLKVIGLINAGRSIRDQVRSSLKDVASSAIVHATFDTLKAPVVLAHGLRSPAWLSKFRRVVEIMSTLLCFIGPPVFTQLILSKIKIPGLRIIYLLNWWLIAAIFILLVIAYIIRVKVAER